MESRIIRARFRDGFARCWRAVSGWRVYLLALILALPDILDALPGVDLTPLLPAWMPGATFAALLAISRLAVRAYATKLATLPIGGPR